MNPPVWFLGERNSRLVAKGSELLEVATGVPVTAIPDGSEWGVATSSGGVLIYYDAPGGSEIARFYVQANTNVWFPAPPCCTDWTDGSVVIDDGDIFVTWFGVK